LLALILRSSAKSDGFCIQLEKTKPLRPRIAEMAVVAVRSGLSGVATMGVQHVRKFTEESPYGTTQFANALLSFLEVTCQLAELEENTQLLAAVPTDDESRKTRQNSANMMQSAKESLVMQQLHVIDLLQDLSSRGGSLVQDSEEEKLQIKANDKRPSTELTMVDVHDLSTSCGESSGSDSEDWSKAGGITKSFRAPPGLTAPPGLCAPPPGLCLPPGLETIASGNEAKKPTPWRSSSASALQSAKKAAPWRSSKVAVMRLSEAASVDKKAVMAVNRRMASVLATVDRD